MVTFSDIATGRSPYVPAPIEPVVDRDLLTSLPMQVWDGSRRHSVYRDGDSAIANPPGIPPYDPRDVHTYHARVPNVGYDKDRLSCLWHLGLAQSLRDVAKFLSGPLPRIPDVREWAWFMGPRPHREDLDAKREVLRHYIAVARELIAEHKPSIGHILNDAVGELNRAAGWLHSGEVMFTHARR